MENPLNLKLAWFFSIIILVLSFLGQGMADQTQSTVKGDVNGDGRIDVTDAVLILQLAAQNPLLADSLLGSADVNQDGRIDLTEAVHALQSHAEMRNPFPVCGAYVAPGVWRIFECYNLAAMGRTTNDDPFIPTWRLIGGYWQWGRKGPDAGRWHDTNTPNFAHGPTGPEAADANPDAVSGWDLGNAPETAWSDIWKTQNDPCPNGFRVPTESQWEGVLENNPQHIVGTWSGSVTNYESARFFGNDLMLPAAGYRLYSSGLLKNRGTLGHYWALGEGLYFTNSQAGLNYYDHRYGLSIRCVEDTFSPSPLEAAITRPAETIHETVFVTFQSVVTGGAGTYSYKWDFGDGSSSSLSRPSHAYRTKGSYTVVLTVMDSAGASQTASIDVTVSKHPYSDVCGAYIAPGVWKVFDCYNLAAAGRATHDDPFIPTWRLIGGYWQWGRKGADPGRWHDTNTPQFAHPPTGSLIFDANLDAVSGWDQTNAPENAWSDTLKTEDDPCHEGFRVPTKIQWEGVLENNTRRTVGTWTDIATNFSSAYYFGDDLMLPAAGCRLSNTGSLRYRGSSGYYWSTSTYTHYSERFSWSLYFTGGLSGSYRFTPQNGFSVRCVAE